MSQLNSSKILSEKEQAEFLRTIETCKHTNRRDYLVLKLALKSGGRAQEVLNVRVCDLNPEQKSIFITGLKGSRSREIPLDPRFFKELSQYVLESGLTDQIFDIGYHRLRDLWAFYRPTKKKFHSLRHGFACRLYRKTNNIHLVKTALGHSNIRNTLVYLDFMYSQNELRKAIL